MNEKSSDTEKNAEASGRGALAEFRSAIGGLFESVVGMAPDFGIGRDWPRHELIVDDDAYRVQVELPGFSREEIDVSVAGRTLTVSGERKKFEPPEGARLLRSERPSGSVTLMSTAPAESMQYTGRRTTASKPRECGGAQETTKPAVKPARRAAKATRPSNRP